MYVTVRRHSSPSWCHCSAAVAATAICYYLYLGNSRLRLGWGANLRLVKECETTVTDADTLISMTLQIMYKIVQKLLFTFYFLIKYLSHLSISSFLKTANDCKCCYGNESWCNTWVIPAVSKVLVLTDFYTKLIICDILSSRMTKRIQYLKMHWILMHCRCGVVRYAL